MFIFILGLSLPLSLAQEEVAETQQQNQKTGVLNISSTTPAQIYIDHQLVGATPFKATLSEGNHLIRIVADGFAIYSCVFAANPVPAPIEKPT